MTPYDLHASAEGSELSERDLIYDWNGLEKVSRLSPKRKVTFLDETLRDGIQSPSVFDPRIEDKIRIVLDGLRGEDSIAELCRKEGIAQSLYYTWSKEFMEAGKRRLAGDTARAATSGEVQDLRREARALKECVADLTLENRLLKKSMIADGGDDE